MIRNKYLYVYLLAMAIAVVGLCTFAPSPAKPQSALERYQYEMQGLMCDVGEGVVMSEFAIQFQKPLMVDIR